MSELHYVVKFEKLDRTITAHVSCELFAIQKSFKGRLARKKALDWAAEQVQQATESVESYLEGRNILPGGTIVE